jgi:hypothetical protein
MPTIEECIDFYKLELNPNEWTFEYDSGFKVILNFPMGSLPHLLGVDKMEKYKLHAVRRKNNPNLRTVSKLCIKDIKKNIIRDETIQSDPSRAEIIRRMENFLMILDIIDSSETTHCHFNKNLVPCIIDADFMLYNSENNLNLNLGLTDSDKKNLTCSSVLRVSPMTVFDEPEGDKYICNQQIVTLKNVTVKSNETGMLVKTFT